MTEDRVIRRKELEATVGLTERRIRTLEFEGKFPRRFLIAENGRTVGWSANEVQEYLADRRTRREQVSKPGVLKPGEQPARAAAV